MARFIVNKNQQANGDYEVHNLTAGCLYLPLPKNQILLGDFSSCHGAVASARQQYPAARINGCKYCCGACHTS